MNKTRFEKLLSRQTKKIAKAYAKVYGEYDHSANNSLYIYFTGRKKNKLFYCAFKNTPDGEEYQIDIYGEVDKDE